MNAQMHPLRDVLDYHRVTKHQLQQYARGPGFLDWAHQPDPFRRYAGARLLPLQKIPITKAPMYDDVFTQERHIPSAQVDYQGISQLFFDSLAISAWKSAGDMRWALRVNASSGNLHPTEGYLVCGPIEGLCNKPMVCHYAPREHALEVLAEFDRVAWDQLSQDYPENTFFIGLTSIHWREAWKYGQRAYRYCMHDAGHAVCALSIAAAGLGWKTRLQEDLGTSELALLLGTFRNGDAEHEEPDILIACTPGQVVPENVGLPVEVIAQFADLSWKGKANVLSTAHVDWGMDEIARVVKKPCIHVPAEHPAHPSVQWVLPGRPVSLRQMIRQRRSAVSMDGQTRMSRANFFRILIRTLALPDAIPFSTMPWKSHIHLAIFVHRVDDLPKGLYLLVRDPVQTEALRELFTQADPWKKPSGCPDDLGLYCLIETDTRAAARAISCQQDIASDSCFSLAMIAQFLEPLQQYGPWFYPRLFWEAGMIGQLLYLEAEAAGIRSTGIGCFFDDAMHEVLGLKGQQYQDLYHFTVGGPVEDTRLTTLPAYPDE